MSFSAEKARYAAKLPAEGGTTSSKLLKESNLEVAGNQVFLNEADMLANLAKMGMAPELLENLTPEQKQKMWSMTQNADILKRAQQQVSRPPPSSAMKEAAGGLYSWKDEKDHICMELKCGEGVKVEIAEEAIKITSGDGQTVLEGKTFQQVDPAKCSWGVAADGSGGKKLAIKLAKAAPMRWLMALR